MLIHPILEQLNQMKLTGMAQALSEQLQEPSTQALSFEERLGFLVDCEMTVKTQRRLQTRLRQANLRFSQASVADIDERKERRLDHRLVAKLATGDWLRAHHNLIITGATGTGKSWLACAFAHKACMLGYRTQYWRLSRLLEELALGRADGRYLKLIKALAHLDLLLLDDLCMVKLVGEHQQHLLDVLDDRYQRASTLVTSQLPIANWHEQIDNPTFGDAILDRLLGEAYQLQLQGPSLRLRDQSIQLNVTGEIKKEEKTQTQPVLDAP